MKQITMLLVLIASLSLTANDGVYITEGGVIYPSSETNISMEEEHLSFTVRDGVVQVDVQFKFNNPDKNPVTTLVGFQAPSAMGDVTEAMSNSLHISDFVIMHEGRILPYDLKVAECEDCELKELGEIVFSQSMPGIFVFLFEVTFAPGINVIQHSYSFPSSSNVSVGEFYNYVLTTGSKWAGGEIDSFTVEIDMGKNKYFYVMDSFGVDAEWSIVGSGIVTDKKFDFIEDNSCQMIRILSGKLKIVVHDFSPQLDIEFGVINPNSFISISTDYAEIKSGEVLGLGYLNFDKKKELTKEDLKKLRNTIYAQHGYEFKSEEWQQYFGQFPWYLPNPNIKIEDILLTKKEQDYVNAILRAEGK